MAKQQFNRRLSDEAITAINWWAKQDSTPARRVTDTEIVERAIAYYDEMRANAGEVSVGDPVINAPASQPRGVRSSVNGDMAVEVPASAFDPSTIPGVSVGVAPKAPAVIKKRYKCDHCGASPAVARVGDICERCQEGGHRGDVRVCPECWNPA